MAGMLLFVTYCGLATASPLEVPNMATTLDDAAVEATRLFCVTMDAIARHPHASKLLAHGCDRLRAAIRAEAERLCTEFDVTVTTEETQQ